MQDIVIVYPKDNWILQRLGDEIVKRQPEIKWFSHADPQIWHSGVLDHPGQINYFINYAVMKRKTTGIDIGFFTHPEPDGEFYHKAKLVDLSICMSEKYTLDLKSRGIPVVHISPGMDPVYTPKLRMAVVGSLAYGFRKGSDLLAAVKNLPYTDLVITNGAYKQEDLPDLYRSVDYTLITSRYEGGPMCLLESLACGKKVICPLDVGYAAEFKDFIIPYRNGDINSLIDVLTDLYRQKLETARAVEKHTWDNWAAAHMYVFNNLN